MWFFFRKFKKAQKLDVGQSFVIFLYMRHASQSERGLGRSEKVEKIQETPIPSSSKVESISKFE